MPDNNILLEDIEYTPEEKSDRLSDVSRENIVLEEADYTPTESSDRLSDISREDIILEEADYIPTEKTDRLSDISREEIILEEVTYEDDGHHSDLSDTAAPVLEDMSTEYKTTYVRRTDYSDVRNVKSSETEVIKASLSEKGKVDQKESLRMYRELMEEKRHAAAAKGLVYSVLVALLGLIVAFLTYLLGYFIAYPIGLAVLSVLFIFKSGFTRRLGILGYTLSAIFLTFGGTIFHIIREQGVEINRDFMILLAATVINIAIVIIICGSDTIHEYHRTKRNVD